MTTWSFEEEEFAALWFGPANDRMLYPLDYLSRFAHTNERDRFWEQVRHHYSDKGELTWDQADMLRRAFTVLTAPEVWAEVHGVSDQAGPIRVAAARHDRQAALAIQFTRKPRIEISLITADTLATQLAGLLPHCPPGARPPEAFAVTDLYPERHPTVHYAGESTPLQRYRRLIRRPADGAGLITVFRGPRNTGAEQPRKVGCVRWYDIRDDGRYLESGNNTITVQPADQPAIQSAIARLLDSALDEYRDYVDDLGEFARR
ncbi:ESX secretion-associated protein EspG [Nocardia alni]|uniref:ESX secretion-associated protein EspG n=1 Tax=Nocardia alni TaxID=2815723 RepID=UPI001C228375|nr:ESX secretion-associated protein EspG [Nocardia alni]